MKYHVQINFYGSTVYGDPIPIHERLLEVEAVDLSAVMRKVAIWAPPAGANKLAISIQEDKR